MTTAEEYFEEAQKNFRKGYCGKAVCNIETAIELNGEKPEYYELMATICNSRHNYDECIYNCSKRIELEPNNAKFYLDRGYYHFLFNKYEKGYEDLTKAIELNPEKTKSFITTGLIPNKYKKKLIVYGIGKFTSLIELYPDNVAYYIERANLYFEQYQYIEALNDCITVLQVDPNYDDNRITANVLYELRFSSKSNYTKDKAILCISKLIELYPNDVKYYDYRGFFYEQQKKYDNAISDYTRCLELNTEKEIYYKKRANCYKKNNQYEEAIVDFTKIMEFNPDESVYMDRIECYKNSGQYDKALIDIQNMITKKCNNVNYYLTRADIYKCMKEYKKSIEDYSEAITLTPKQSTLYLYRAECYKKLKIYDKAEADYCMAIKINPSVENYSKRAYFYKGIGHYDEAIDDFSKIINRYPNKIFERAYCYYQLKDYIEALEDYKTLLEFCKDEKIRDKSEDAINRIKEFL